MMIRQLFIFLFFFTIEVRVKADTPIQRPAACWKRSQIDCAVSASREENLTLKMNQTSLFMPPNSIVLRSKTEFYLIKGTIMFQSHNPIKIHTPYGLVQANTGDFWIRKSDNSYEIFNLSSQVKVTLNDLKQVEIPKGFSIWIGGLDHNKVSAYGAPKIITLLDIISVKKLQYNDPTLLVKEVIKLKEQLSSFNDAGSDLYQKVTERHIAMAEERRQQQQADQRRKLEQKLKLKNLYYEKVFFK